MTKPALKLVKTKKKSAIKQKSKANGKQPHIPHSISHIPYPISQTSNLRPSILTPAERAEAARFRALTKQRAARQAKVRRIVAKLNELDNRAPNAA